MQVADGVRIWSDGQQEAGLSLDDAALLLSSMSNRMRLGALLRLTEREWSVNELCRELGISQSALSQHLGKLRHANLVKVRVDSQARYYRCESDLVIRLLSQLELRG
jgi:ArsR family transcriptional regulator, virulence genes transcriptional regulator